MDHYLTDFTELLPPAPKESDEKASYFSRAAQLGPEAFLLLDRGVTTREIDQRVEYATTIRIDSDLKEELLNDGFTDVEFRAINDRHNNIPPNLMAKVRTAIVNIGLTEGAKLEFRQKKRDHANSMKDKLGREDVAQLIQKLARGSPRLAGPENMHAIDEMVASIHASAPWMREVSIWLHSTLRAQYAESKPWLCLPPFILVGPPGSGKSTYARKLAALAGTPIRAFDAAASGASFSIAGAEATWRNAQAGIPLQEIAQSGVANPIIIVDEIDKCGRMSSSSGQSVSLPDALLGLLEPSTSTAWECPFTRRSFNMSQINWVLTANDIEGIFPPLLDRCRVFNVEYPTLDDLDALIRSQSNGRLYDEVIEQLIGRASNAIQVGQPISLRGLQKLIDEAATVMTQPIFH